MTTGMDLKVARVRARVSATDIALIMGVSRQRVSQIETLPRVTDEMARRYRDALLQLTERPQNVAEAV